VRCAPERRLTLLLATAVGVMSRSVHSSATPVTCEPHRSWRPGGPPSGGPLLHTPCSDNRVRPGECRTPDRNCIDRSSPLTSHKFRYLRRNRDCRDAVRDAAVWCCCSQDSGRGAGNRHTRRARSGCSAARSSEIGLLLLRHHRPVSAARMQFRMDEHESFMNGEPKRLGYRAWPSGSRERAEVGERGPNWDGGGTPGNAPPLLLGDAQCRRS